MDRAPEPLVDRVIRIARIRAVQERLFEQVKAGGPSRWNAIRRIYRAERRSGGYSPYPVDWVSIMTPIELAAWDTIRHFGLPMYPQYPVLRYFVDFADPTERIAIECDGKQWHDAARDEERDADLRAVGWRVYRFTGRQCNLPFDHPDSSHQGIREIAWREYRRALAAPQED